MYRVLANQRGALWVTLSFMVIPLVAMAMAVHFDLSRAMWVRAQLQTAADAGALAGVLTAETVAEKDVEVQYDGSGNITGVVEKIVKWHVRINDPDAAYDAARSAVIRNTLLLPPREGGFTLLEDFNPTDISGQVLGEDSYMVNAQARVSTLILGKAMKLYGQAEADTLTARVTGVARAFPD
ncbi:MAG: pilus assembly protein TadG-related protein [Bacillota bacterium]